MSLASITKAQVPEFLVGSDFYNSLSSEDGEEFCVPEAHLKRTSVVKAPEDLSHLLHTIQFWGLHKLPNELIDFLQKKSAPEHADETKAVLQEFDDTFHLHQLYQDFQLATTPKERVDAAVSSGIKDVIEHVVSFNKPATAGMAKVAAENGLVDLLRITSERLRTKGKNWFTQVSVRKVAAGGHTECLRFALTNGSKVEPNVCLAAAEHGHFECLVAAHDLGCEWDSKVTNVASLHGHCKCLQFALEQGCPVGADATYNAALNGHLECLRLLLDRSAPMSKRACNAAACHGHLECLALLHVRGCPWDATCGKFAAQSGHLDCLKYIANGLCALRASVADAAASEGHLECLRYLLVDCKLSASSGGVDGAAKGGHLDCLKLLREGNLQVNYLDIVHAIRDSKAVTYVRSLLEAGFVVPRVLPLVAVIVSNNACLAYLCAHLAEIDCELTSEEPAEAAANGNIEALKILHQHDCPWDETATGKAASEGHLDCLKYLLEHGCPLSADACAGAARGGHLQILETLQAHGAALTSAACVAAIEADHEDCLLFAIEHGAPLHADMCVAAVESDAASPSGHPHHLLHYLHEELHCPWDERTCAAAAQCAKADLLAYVHEHGCPWDVTTMNAAAVAACSDDDCFAYAFEKGCPRDESTCAAVAAYETWLYPYAIYRRLRLLHESGCPWDVSTTRGATENANMLVLDYAHTHGCPWDASIPRAAAQNGNLDLLEYAHEKSCPWDVSVSRAAHDSKSEKCLQFCVEKGCPIDKEIMDEYNRQNDWSVIILYV